MFTFHSLVQFLLPTVKLNGVSQPISMEYKMVHIVQSKLCLQPKISKTLQSWTCPVFSHVLEHVSGDTLREKSWIISVTAGQK